MVKYALRCVTCNEHFEAWFSSSDSFDMQRDAALLSCPNCEGHAVVKQIMSPMVSGTKSRDASGISAADFGTALRRMRDHVANNFEYVGENFATTARQMHSGDLPEKPVWGKVTPGEVRELAEDGVPAQPLPDIIAPKTPDETKKLN